MNHMKFMKKTVCSSLVLASFLQTVAPLCAMDDLREGFPAAQAAAAQGSTRAVRRDADLTREEKDYVFELNKAINRPFTESIRSLVGDVIGLINDTVADNEKVKSFYVVMLSSRFEEVESSICFFREMKKKYEQREGQHIWTVAGNVYDSFEERFKALKGKLPKSEIFSLQEFEIFCEESLRFIENVLVLHRGLTDFPKTGGGFRLHVFPDYEDSPSDLKTEKNYLWQWHNFKKELLGLNQELIERKMIEVNPRLREEMERKRQAAEAEAQRIEEEHQRRREEAALRQRREEDARVAKARERGEEERAVTEARMRAAEEAVRRAAEEEGARREAERILAEERLRAAEVAAAAERAAAAVAEKERIKAPLKEAYNEISRTIEAINANARKKYSDANEGIMKFGDNETGGGNKLLARIRVLLPDLFNLHGLAYQGPIEREVVQKPSQAIRRAQDEVVAFYEFLNANKSLDIIEMTALNFIDSAKGNGGHFLDYFKLNRNGGEGFSVLFDKYVERNANDNQIKEFSSRIIRFGVADDGHSHRLLHPLLLAKVVWDQRPALRPQVNDILVSFFSQTAEQSGRCATGATGRTNLMLYQLCGLLIEAPLQP